MIVASDFAASAILGANPLRRRPRNFKAVQRSVPGSDIEYAPPPQAPVFNLSKNLRKPFIVVDPPQFSGVPLKSLQQYSHAEGAMLLDAPQELVIQPLKAPVPTSAVLDYRPLLEDLEMPFRREFQYDKGIRPGVRDIKLDAVNEPAYPFPTRTGIPVAPKLQMGTFRIGSQEISLLGY
jgi:hypothetical protein